MANDVARMIFGLAKVQMKVDAVKKQEKEEKFWNSVKNEENTLRFSIRQYLDNDNTYDMEFVCAVEEMEFFIILNEENRLRIKADKAGFFSSIKSNLYAYPSDSFEKLLRGEITNKLCFYEMSWGIYGKDMYGNFEPWHTQGMIGDALVLEYADILVESIDALKKLGYFG